ncbi:MAG: hypothetical protein JSS09_08810 [Verrucomicrobia bacterium]|nr:hypothetical protein [Verrucomicrobiota bacterium]
MLHIINLKKDIKEIRDYYRLQQENVSEEPDLVQRVFYQVTQEAYEQLNSSEKKILNRLYTDIFNTSYANHPDYVELLSTYQKVTAKARIHLPPPKQIQREYDEILENWNKETALPQEKEAYRRITTYTAGDSPLDLSNLGLTQLPKCLFINPIFNNANLSGNPLEDLPEGLTIGSICNLENHAYVKKVLTLSKIPICFIAPLEEFAEKTESKSIEEIIKSAHHYTSHPPHVDKRDIVILPSYPIKPQVHPESINLLGCDLTSLNISEEHAKKLILHLSSIVSHPRKLLKLLQPIEDALAAELEKKGISFTEDDNPKFILGGEGLFVLGPPQQDFFRKRKERIIDQVLLTAEQKIGLNEKGSPVFVGFVDSKKANPFVMEGNVFKEDIGVFRMLLHGKNTHRLAILAFIESLKGTEFEDVSPKTVLKLLIQTNIENSSTWAFLLDTNKNVNYQENPDVFDYNCRSPFIFNSLILCFGTQLGLPHLTHCMQDSFWKAAYKMVDEVLKDPSAIGMSKESLYVTIMKELESVGNLSNVDQEFPFTKHKTIAALHPKYIPHPDAIQGVKLKTPRGSSVDLENHKQIILEEMRDWNTFKKIAKDSDFHGLISEFLKTHISIEELAVYGKCCYLSKKLSLIFNEIAKERCLDTATRILFIHSLLENKLLALTVKFINNYLDELPILIANLTLDQKKDILRVSIKNDCIDFVKEFLKTKISPTELIMYGEYFHFAPDKFISIFTETVNRNCKNINQKIKFSYLLIEKNLNDLATNLIANSPEMDELILGLMPKLSIEQKKSLLTESINKDFTEVIEKMNHLGIELN